MATITVTPSQTYGPTDTVTSTNLNLLGGPTAALDAGTIVDADISASANIAGSKLASDALAAAYPVGSIYMNASDSTNPSTLLGFGTWVAFGAGKVPVGIDAGDTDFDTAEETGGVKEVTLTSSQSGVPAHAHKFRITGDSTVDSGKSGGIVVSGGGETENGVTGTPTDNEGQQIGGNTAADASSAHNNLQPYIVVHMWKRTA